MINRNYTQYPIPNTQYVSGFTLVELLIGITILAVIAGISGDMVISSIRSYNKSQVLNTITQNGNYALGVLRDDIQNAKSLTCNNSYQMTLTNRDGANVKYTLAPTNCTGANVNGSLTRNINTGASSTVHVWDNDPSPTGSASSGFSCNGNLVSVTLVLGQACIGGSRMDTTATTVLKSSVVVRGGYN